MASGSQIAKVVLCHTIVRVVGLGNEDSNNKLRSSDNTDDPSIAKISVYSRPFNSRENPLCPPQIFEALYAFWKTTANLVREVGTAVCRSAETFSGDEALETVESG